MHFILQYDYLVRGFRHRAIVTVCAFTVGVLPSAFGSPAGLILSVRLLSACWFVTVSAFTVGVLVSVCYWRHVNSLSACCLPLCLSLSVRLLWLWSVLTSVFIHAASRDFVGETLNNRC